MSKDFFLHLHLHLLNTFKETMNFRIKKSEPFAGRIHDAVIEVVSHSTITDNAIVLTSNCATPREMQFECDELIAELKALKASLESKRFWD